MSAPQVSTTVRQALAEAACCEVTDITGDTPLRSGELLDSLDTFEAVVDIEDHLGITLTDGDIEQCKTAGDLMSLCERLVAMRTTKP